MREPDELQKADIKGAGFINLPLSQFPQWYALVTDCQGAHGLVKRRGSVCVYKDRPLLFTLCMTLARAHTYLGAELLLSPFSPPLLYSSKLGFT